jgi:hypothetical protein
MMNTIIGALIAALIAFGTGAIALLTQEGVQNLSDISTVAWLVLGIGAGITFLKDFQAISTRRIINTVTHTGDGGGKVG